MNAVEPILAGGVPSAGALPRAAPEDVGLSPTRLARIAAMLYGDVARGQLPGAVVAIVRRGKLVAHDAYGYRDKGAGLPMTTVCIFNIASMTKPMTAVAALMLVEEGRLQLDEPLWKYFPKIGANGVAIVDETGPSSGRNTRRAASSCSI
jgi:CubicO group peptidase (beta-lactamase class C family)